MTYSIFAHARYYLYNGILQTCEMYIIYAFKHIVFGILVKKYFVTLQLYCEYWLRLGDAISSIVKVKEQTDLFSFLDGDTGSLFGNEIRGLDDFELICFLVVR